MIKSSMDKFGYKNEITKYLDEHLIKAEYCIDIYSNYIYPSPHGNKWIIRIPGMSVGNLEVVDGIVKSIKLYEDSFCYEREVLDNLDQFIGKEIGL